MYLRFAIEFAPRHTALRARGASLRVHIHALHQRQIDHDSIIDGRPASHIMAAAAHRDLESVLPGEIDRLGDVRDGSTLRDQRRVLVDHAIVQLARLIVIRIS